MDPDPGGPKTFGFGGSGSGTLIFTKTFSPAFHWSSLCEGEQDGARHQDGLDEAAARQVSGGGGEEAVLHALADGRPGRGEHEEGARPHPRT
jgi:hypothetical protein